MQSSWTKDKRQYIHVILLQDIETHKKTYPPPLNIEKIMKDKGANVLKFVSNEGLEFVEKEDTEDAD